MQRPFSRAARCAHVLSSRSWRPRLAFGVILLGTTALMSATVLYGQGSDQALFIDPQGRVGIGKDKPEATLDVQGNMQISGTTRLNQSVGINHDPIANQQLIIVTKKDHVPFNVTNPDNTINWLSVFADGQVLMNGGNVGIGTTKPAARLDVQHGTRTGQTHPTAVKGLYVTGDFSEDQGVEFRHNNGTQGIGFGLNTIYATGNTDNQDLKLKPKGNGTVAIVTSQDHLFISGKDGTVSVTNNAYRADNTWVIKNEKKKAFTFEIRDSGMLELYGTQTNGQTDWRKMATFDAVNNKVEFPSGNVHVSGDLIVDGTITATKSVQTKDAFVNGSGWRLDAGGDTAFRANSKDALWYTSDVRLKTGVHPIPTALEKVSQLRGVTYHWNQEAFDYFTRDMAHTMLAGPETAAEEHQQSLRAARENIAVQHAGSQMGLIAQEVEAVVPEVVTTDKAGYKAIKYPHLTALLIEAVKEQQALIEVQHADIMRLQASTTALQAQVQDLQARVVAARATQGALEDIQAQLAQLSAAVQRVTATRKAGTTDVGQVIMQRQ